MRIHEMSRGSHVAGAGATVFGFDKHVAPIDDTSQLFIAHLKRVTKTINDNLLWYFFDRFISSQEPANYLKFSLKYFLLSPGVNFNMKSYDFSLFEDAVKTKILDFIYLYLF